MKDERERERNVAQGVRREERQKKETKDLEGKKRFEEEEEGIARLFIKLLSLQPLIQHLTDATHANSLIHTKPRQTYRLRRCDVVLFYDYEALHKRALPLSLFFSSTCKVLTNDSSLIMSHDSPEAR